MISYVAQIQSITTHLDTVDTPDRLRGDLVGIVEYLLGLI